MFIKAITAENVVIVSEKLICSAAFCFFFYGVFAYYESCVWRVAV